MIEVAEVAWAIAYAIGLAAFMLVLPHDPEGLGQIPATSCAGWCSSAATPWSPRALGGQRLVARTQGRRRRADRRPARRDHDRLARDGVALGGPFVRRHRAPLPAECRSRVSTFQPSPLEPRVEIEPFRMPGSRRPASEARVYRMIVPWQTMTVLRSRVVRGDLARARAVRARRPRPDRLGAGVVAMPGCRAIISLAIRALVARRSRVRRVPDSSGRARCRGRRR